MDALFRQASHRTNSGQQIFKQWSLSALSVAPHLVRVLVSGLPDAIR